MKIEDFFQECFLFATSIWITVSGSPLLEMRGWPRQAVSGLSETTKKVKEKRTPHCSLAAVKALVAAGKVRTTHSARAGAAALGFDFPGMTAAVMNLTMADFYKTLTTQYGKMFTGQTPRQEECI